MCRSHASLWGTVSPMPDRSCKASVSWNMTRAAAPPMKYASSEGNQKAQAFKSRLKRLSLSPQKISRPSWHLYPRCAGKGNRFSQAAQNRHIRKTFGLKRIPVPPEVSTGSTGAPKRRVAPPLSRGYAARLRTYHSRAGAGKCVAA